MIRFRHYKSNKHLDRNRQNAYGFQIWSAGRGHRAIDIWWKKELFVIWLDRRFK